MDLRGAFEIAMTEEAYLALLDGDRRRLHEHHGARAEIDPEPIERLRSAGPYRMLVITEPWCGDSSAIFPVIARLCREAGIELRVVRRDEHPELIDRYLTHGGRAIPMAVALDGRFRELFHWGPRPAPAQAILTGCRGDIAAGRIDKTDVHKRIRAFYARDRGKTVAAELFAGFGVAAN